MLANHLFAPPSPPVGIVGTGRLTLDVIVTEGPDAPPPRSQAGGSCGNVLAILAYLGWLAHPLTRLGQDDPGSSFSRDLERWGARLDLIRYLPEVSSPIIIHRIRHLPSSQAVHSFSSRCPFCDRRLTGYQPVPRRFVEDLLPSLPPARVFFTDRDSEGSLLLGRTLAERGALVVFEPNYDGDQRLFPEMLQLCHILKYARQRLPGLADRWPLREPLLVIETLGEEGLRYRDQRQGMSDWQVLPALPVAVVRDAGGCGDWTTAGLIHVLGQDGAEGLRRADPDTVQQGLRFGQALAAWNCAFEGARGGVYQVDREQMQQSVLDLLGGASGDPAAGAGAGNLPEAGRFCPHCGGQDGNTGNRGASEEGEGRG
jgi:fructokinase